MVSEALARKLGQENTEGRSCFGEKQARIRQSSGLAIFLRFIFLRSIFLRSIFLRSIFLPPFSCRSHSLSAAVTRSDRHGPR